VRMRKSADFHVTPFQVVTHAQTKLFRRPDVPPKEPVSTDDRQSHRFVRDGGSKTVQHQLSRLN